MTELTNAQKKVKEIVNAKLDSIEMLLESARKCLADNNYFQAMVRIDEVGKLATFDSRVMELFELLSEKE